MNVPKLRFPGFAGEWRKVTAGACYEFRNGLNFTKDMTGEEVKILGVANFQSNEYFDDASSLPTIRIADRLSQKDVLEENDLVFVRSNGNKALIGRCMHVGPINTRVSHSGFTIRGRNTDPALNSAFGGILFRSSRFRRYLDGMGGGTNISNLSQAILSGYGLSIPSLPEQQKIAAFLGAVDARLAALAAKQAALGRFKAGLMQKLFSQQLRFTREDGGAFPDWQEKRLGEVAHIVGGGTPESHVPEFWGGDIVWFTPTEIKSKYLQRSRRTISAEGLKSSSAKLLPVGALLLSTRATVGDVGIATVECCTNQGFQSLIIKARHNNEFWYYWLLNNKKAILRKASGSTFLEIGKSEVVKLPISVPHPDEQQKIANALSAMDARIQAVADQVSKLQTFKKGLLQQMFV